MKRDIGACYGAEPAGSAHSALTKRERWQPGGFGVALFAFVFVLLAYFFSSGSWNQNARLDAIYAFVEPGSDQFTFRINRFLWNARAGLNTGDWALHAGNYYANKAPLSILLGVLVYWPLHAFETSLLGLEASAPVVEIANAYAINLGVSVLLASFGCVALFRLFEAFGVPRPWALGFALVSTLGTATFPYSTELWGASTTAALVVFGALALVARTARGAAIAGLCFGLAVTTDYLAAVFVPLAATYLFLAQRRHATHFIAGGVLPALLLSGYHYYCFDNPFTTASSLSARAFVEESRWLGFFGVPTPDALWHLTFGLARGVFNQMPVLLLGLLGFVLWWRRDRRDPFLWLCGASFLVPLVLVASFNGWHGGVTICARYLIPALVWLVVPFKELPRTRLTLGAVGTLGAVSVFNMLTVAATNPVGIASGNPLYAWAYPHFFAGDIGVASQPTRLQALHPGWPNIAPYTCFNWGEVFGLKGLVSLVPFLLILGAGGTLLFRYAARDTPRAIRRSR